MAKEIKIQATVRKAHGSGEARRIRRGGGVPAVLTRLDGSTETIRLDSHGFGLLLRKQAGEHMLVSLEIEDRAVTALLREVQHDVIDGKAIHADFSELDLSKRMRATVAIRLLGEPVGVRTGGGVLTQSAREVVVECLPSDYVEVFDVDVSGLELGQSLSADELPLGESYELITHGDVPIAAVVTVEDEEEAEGTEAAAGETDEEATPEVITKGKQEDEDEEGAGASAKK